MDHFLKENLITTRDAGELSGYTSDYLARLVRSGKISGTKIGRNWLVDRISLEHFLDEQGDRKSDYARALVRAREEEYRAHRSLLGRASNVLSRTFSAPPQIGIGDASPSSRILAFSVALAVVVSGAVAAQAEVIPQLAERVASLSGEVAFGFGETFGDIPSRIASRIGAADRAMRAQVAIVAARNASLSTRIASPRVAAFDLSSVRMELPENAPARSRVVFASAQSAIRPTMDVRDLRSGAADAYALLTSPENLARASAGAYFATGEYGYARIVAALHFYRSFVESSGEAALSLAVRARDAFPTASRIISRANLGFGSSIIEATHAAIGADVALARGLAAAAPESARVTVALIGGAGDALSRSVANAPALATALYLRATEIPAVLAPAIVYAVFDAEYKAAAHFVTLTRAVSDRYVELVLGAGRLAYAGAENARALVSVPIGLAHHTSRATGQFFFRAPAALKDAYLGALGNIAHVGTSYVPTWVDSVATGLYSNQIVAAALAAASPALSRGEQTALATYKTIRSLFDSANRALATLFAPPPAIVLPGGIPKTRVAATAAPSSPARANAGTSYSTYPTYTTVVQGVSADYVNQSLDSLRANVLATVAGMIQPVAAQTATNVTTIQQVNMIQDLSNLIVRNGDFRGGTFDGGTLSNGLSVSATTGSFTNLSVTNNLGIGTTSPSQALSVTGKIYTTGGIQFPDGSVQVSAGGSGGVSSVTQTYGAAQTGALTLATSTATTFNGLTISNALTNSGTAFTFAPPTITGTLSAAGGGTGSTTLSGILAGNGTSAVKSVIIGSNLTFDGTTLAATGGGTGTVSTSSSETAGQLSYWTTTGGTPARLGGVATSSLSVGTGLTNSGTLGSQVGGSAASISFAPIAANSLWVNQTGAS
ncbi:helix-turn-helix domain-containing protein, partial [Candidatus Kaiserbacteria bacterium]|nr:helix-turn-helix domain-containing protein [Candidatus Kaiserbacteria bacterium]